MRRFLGAATTSLLVVPFLLTAQTQTPVGVVVGSDSLNYQMMHEGLNVRWIQGYGGNMSEHRRIETETESIFSVISVRNQLIVKSASERRWVEAEDNDDAGDTRDYFAFRETGQDDPSGARTCRPADHDEGYMVACPRPNNEFFYRDTRYYATFRLRITTPAEVEPVVTLTAGFYRGAILYDETVRVIMSSEFSGSQPLDVTVSWAVPPIGTATLAKPGILLGKPLAESSSTDTLHLTVYWHDRVETWLDYVIL